MEQNQQVASVKSKGRWSEEKIRQILDDQWRSGLTVKAYCEANSMSEKTFYRWLKKNRDKAGKRSKRQGPVKGGFASIEVIEATADPRPRLFAEVGNIRLYKEVPAEYLKILLS